jgi:gamma-glutamylputrescine oxidase
MSSVGWDVDPVVQATPARAPLTESVTADVCVIGLGGSGLAAIGELIKRGRSVVGVDAGRVAAGAAGRNGGFLLAGPAVAVHRAGEGWGLRSALELYRETLDEIGMLTDLLGPEVIRRVGSIRLVGLPGEPRSDAEAADREAEAADCADQYQAMTEYGLAVERYSGPLGSGLFIPHDAAMNPARRALGLAELYGVRARLYENSPVTAIGPGMVTTERGSITAGAVIVAVDGKLDLLLPELADRVRTARLQMLATAPIAANRLPCPVYGRWGYDYAQQDTSGRLLIGGGRDQFEDREWTHSTEPTDEVQGWIEGIAERFAGSAVTVTHRWAASVGFTEDARPLVAEVRDGVVACGGYNGTGNLVGPIAARAAVSLALDGVKPADYFSA